MPASAGSTLGHVALDDVDHRVVLDPVDAFLRVARRPVLGRQEPVALEAPRRHQDEHAERRVAEAHVLGQRLGHQAHQQVHLLDVAVVDPLDLLGPFLVVAELLEGLDRRLVEQAPELVVARHAALAVAQDVHRGEVEALAGGVLVQVLQVLREVVQPQRAGMRDAERVEQVGAVVLLDHLAARAPRHLRQLARLEQRVVLHRADLEVVRQQRVHAVHRRELLGERVGRRVVIGRRPGNAAERDRCPPGCGTPSAARAAGRASWC